MRLTFSVRLFAAALLLLVAAGPVHAAGLIGDTRVPFSADRVVTTGGKTYRGRIYAIPGKQRHEQDLNGLPAVAILRADRELAWIMLPDLKIFAELRFPDAVADYGDPRLLKAPVSSETIDGVKTSKYRLEHRGADGSAVDGWLWMSSDGIVMKLDATFTSPDAKSMHATLELSNLHKGAQDASLFELPPGINKLPPEALESLMNLKVRK